MVSRRDGWVGQTDRQKTAFLVRIQKQTRSLVAESPMDGSTVNRRPFNKYGTRMPFFLYPDHRVDRRVITRDEREGGWVVASISLIDLSSLSSRPSLVTRQQHRYPSLHVHQNVSSIAILERSRRNVEMRRCSFDASPNGGWRSSRRLVISRSRTWSGSANGFSSISLLPFVESRLQLFRAVPWQ